MQGVTAGVTADPLDVAAAIAHVSSSEAGGIAVFVGTVRASAAVADNADKNVAQLDYDAHPTLAAERITAIAQQAAEKWGLVRVVAVHRTGMCELGEPTVVVACSAPHRREALDACGWVIDEIKASVPIWKREVYTDGSAWVGAEGA